MFKKCSKATQLPFTPLPFLHSPHIQTMIATLPTRKKAPPSEVNHLDLTDGDQLIYKVSTPDNWNKNDRTVVLIHGFGGSHRSAHLIRLTNILYKKNYCVVRTNIRGCGPGRALSKKICHVGQSDDILQLLQSLKRKKPLSPITLIGFSMGGNLILKLAGELQNQACEYMEKVISICPPIDPKSTAKLISSPENRYYEKYFLSQLRADVKYRKKLFPDLPDVQFSRDLSLLEFDRLYSAPFWGFTDIDHYYEYTGASRVISNIKIPCHILFSEDDPIIDPRRLNDIEIPENVHIWQTKYGGHLGFIGSFSKEFQFRWLDKQIVSWLEE